MNNSDLLCGADLLCIFMIACFIFLIGFAAGGVTSENRLKSTLLKNNVAYHEPGSGNFIIITNPTPFTISTNK